MHRYLVLGNTSVVVSIEVDANSEKEALAKANKKFPHGVKCFAGNGGINKLIGVDGETECIFSDEPVEFDDIIGYASEPIN